MCVVTVCGRAGYRIGLEEFDGAVIGHFTALLPASAQMIRQARADVDTLLSMQGRPIYTMAVSPHGGDVTKHAKFCRLMGFVPSTNTLCTDGQIRQVYIRGV